MIALPLWLIIIIIIIPFLSPLLSAPHPKTSASTHPHFPSVYVCAWGKTLWSACILTSLFPCLHIKTPPHDPLRQQKRVDCHEKSISRAIKNPLRMIHVCSCIRHMLLFMYFLVSFILPCFTFVALSCQASMLGLYCATLFLVNLDFPTLGVIVVFHFRFAVLLSKSSSSHVFACVLAKATFGVVNSLQTKKPIMPDKSVLGIHWDCVAIGVY